MSRDDNGRLSTAEAEQPWVVYHYGLTHDRWWPLWTSTRLLGRAKIVMECAVCGDRKTASLKIPRFGRVPEPATGRHPARERFLTEHAHPERGAPMSWAKPLLNPAAHPGGVSLDALAIRLQADLYRDEEAGG
jgi:hypothetical protein